MKKNKNSVCVDQEKMQEEEEYTYKGRRRIYKGRKVINKCVWVFGQGREEETQK
jgi:hypothetical protein